MNTLHLTVTNDSTSYSERRAIALHALGFPLSVHADALRQIVRDAAHQERAQFGATFSHLAIREACELVATHDRGAWLDELRTNASVTIAGRRWFQRSYGNTYHSVTIYADGFSFILSTQYGYGDQWEQTARDWLRDVGFTGTVEVGSVTDVARERDL